MPDAAFSSVSLSVNTTANSITVDPLIFVADDTCASARFASPKWAQRGAGDNAEELSHHIRAAG